MCVELSLCHISLVSDYLFSYPGVEIIRYIIAFIERTQVHRECNVL